MAKPLKDMTCSLKKLGITCIHRLCNVCTDSLLCCNSTNLVCLKRQKGKCTLEIGTCNLGLPYNQLSVEEKETIPRYEEKLEHVFELFLNDDGHLISEGIFRTVDDAERYGKHLLEECAKLSLTKVYTIQRRFVSSFKKELN